MGVYASAIKSECIKRVFLKPLIPADLSVPVVATLSPMLVLCYLEWRKVLLPVSLVAKPHLSHSSVCLLIYAQAWGECGW